MTSSKISTLPYSSQTSRRPCRKPGSGQDAVHIAGNRFDDDAGDLIAGSGEGVTDLIEIVVAQGDGVLGQ